MRLKFNEKDICFDAFVECICDTFTLNDFDAVGYVQDIPVHIHSQYDSEMCQIDAINFWQHKKLWQMLKNEIFPQFSQVAEDITLVYIGGNKVAINKKEQL